ncbi:hypothetical protein CHS0354_025162 [Potamilus streckersoni]|uniref:Uncharacterized protein n=1 Tax=Potamilus streckersoni TaxID=2493646 RepID=A0AAE0VL43_9BIVA|nr:hypothetical protein CHS0354_025162 [Potamilus streckersoni]
MVEYLPVSMECITAIQRETETDLQLRQLKKSFRKDGQEKKKVLPQELQYYFPFREEQTLQNGLIFKSIQRESETDFQLRQLKKSFREDGQEKKGRGSKWKGTWRILYLMLIFQVIKIL